MDSIIIEDLTVNCIIGILPHERQYMQPVVCNVRLDTDFSKVAYQEDLAEGISYAEVSQFIKNYIINARALLLETLAYDICDQVLERYVGVNKIEISLMKPNAVVDCKSVGVLVSKERN